VLLSLLFLAFPFSPTGLEKSLLDQVGHRLRADLERFDRAGYWGRGDSAIYAWTCGQHLASMIELYKATKNREWLDLFASVVDKMFDALTPDEEGFLSWRTRFYTGAFVAVKPLPRNKSRARLEPEKQWIYDLRVARSIERDRTLVLAFEGGRGNEWTVKVEDKTSGKRVALLTVREGKRFLIPPGVPLTLRGRPSPGDGFSILIRRPKEFAYAVHDGVILAPVCRCVLLVRKDPKLASAHGRRAGRYLRVMEEHLVSKWDRYWRDLGKRRGVLVFPNDPSFRYPGITLPHNQYLALGRVLVLLWRITGKEGYRRRAEKMGRFFKSCLRKVDDCYLWHYWDPAGPWDEELAKVDRPRPEDTGHATLDIGFVLEAEEAGIVFTREDLRLFANTFVKTMWNGSLKEPRVGGWVGSKRPSRQSANLQEWVRLCKVEPLILEICKRIIPRSGSLLAKAQLLALLARGGGN